MWMNATLKQESPSHLNVMLLTRAPVGLAHRNTIQNVSYGFTHHNHKLWQ